MSLYNTLQVVSGLLLCAQESCRHCFIFVLRFTDRIKFLLHFSFGDSFHSDTWLCELAAQHLLNLLLNRLFVSEYDRLCCVFLFNLFFNQWLSIFSPSEVRIEKHEPSCHLFSHLGERLHSLWHLSL